MAECAQCGAELGDDDAQCASCGAPVGTDGGSSDGGGTNRAMLVAAIIVMGVLIAGGIAYAIAQLPMFSSESAKAPSVASVESTGSTGGSQVATTLPAAVTTATPSKAATASPTTSGAGGTTNTAEDGKHFGAITALKTSGGISTLTMDYKQLYTGAEATKQAKARGDEVNNDYYIVNPDKTPHRFPVTADVAVVLHPGQGAQFSHQFTLSEFRTMFTGSVEKSAGGHLYTAKNWNWYVTIKNGRVVRIENFWTP